ncbi:hypothetical protein ABID21_004976 [Pseudorhizobium tarimense]|uniref:Uncharacterized protein n=1 Tax=Pseudorhizobium tarimense TaxID=1079109 RepID=A0ABV2HE78_9HYPH
MNRRQFFKSLAASVLLCGFAGKSTLSVALHLTPRIRRSNFRGIARHLI